MHNLYAVKDTPLGDQYERGEVTLMERDEYVRTVVDVLELLPPTMIVERVSGDSSLQIDLSTSYQVTPQLNVFFEALNVTNDTISTHGRFDNQMLDAFAYGRRYALGVRVRL